VLNRYADWLEQAKNDYEWGLASARSDFHSQACFIAQQVAEKALKALAYYRGAEFVRGHSVAQVCEELKINGELEQAAFRLDQYYIPTRYPDAQPAGAPFKYFSEAQSSEALSFASMFLEKVDDEIGSGEAREI
jgi:HEPN domain-containing protein